MHKSDSKSGASEKSHDSLHPPHYYHQESHKNESHSKVNLARSSRSRTTSSKRSSHNNKSHSVESKGLVPAERVSAIANDLIDDVLDKYIKQKKRASSTGSKEGTGPPRSKSRARVSKESQDKENVNEPSINDLFKLGNCLDCKQWNRNYHPCLFSGPEENAVCREEMKRRGYEYHDPKDLCHKSGHDIGYQAGHFYALNPESHMDDFHASMEQHQHGNLSRSHSRNDLSSKSHHSTHKVRDGSKSDDHGGSSRSKTRQGSENHLHPGDSHHHTTKKKSSKNLSKSHLDTDGHTARTKSSHSGKKLSAENKSSHTSHHGHAHVHYPGVKDGKCGPHETCPKGRAPDKDDVSNSDFEYVHKLHPHAHSHTEEVSRDKLVPLPNHLHESKDHSSHHGTSSHNRFQPETPSMPHLEPEIIHAADVHCGLHNDVNNPNCKIYNQGNPTSQAKTGGKNGRNGGYDLQAPLSSDDLEVKELFSLGRSGPCKWGKNYHPCNNPDNKEDAKTCQAWKEEQVKAEGNKETTKTPPNTPRLSTDAEKTENSPPSGD